MNLSSQHRFSAAELKTLGLWDSVEQFGKKKPAPTANTKKNNPTLTVDEIETMQKQAHDEAFVQGQKQGYEQGFEQGKAEGIKAGFEQGKIEGSKQGYEENQHLLQKQSTALVSLLESLAEPFKTLDEAVETELVNLAIGIASQLVRREIKKDSGQIIAVIREAINVLPLAAQKITLYLHPTDAELVRSSLALDESAPSWDLVEDPLITQGGCKVQTDTSLIDITVENRLAAIVANILGGERQEDEAQ